MTASRATANARIVSKHQRKSTHQAAKASAVQFSKKQSHFERRQEEKYVKHLRQQSASSLLEDSSTPDRGASVFRHTASSASASASAAAASPFSSRFLGETPRSAAAWTAPPSTLVTGSALLDRSASAQLLQRGGGAKHRAAGQSGRSSRRADRYHLGEGDDLPETSSPLDRPSALEHGGSSSGSQGGETLLGLRRLTFEDENEGRNGEVSNSTGARSKEERFQQVVENTKRQRIEKQHERSEADAALDALDEEFSALKHLLPMRDKVSEEYKAFQKSGTPEVRALLRAYKQKRGKQARRLVIRTRKGGESGAGEMDGGEGKGRDGVSKEIAYVVPLTVDEEGDKATSSSRHQKRPGTDATKKKKEPTPMHSVVGPPPSFPAPVKLTVEDQQRLEDILRFGESPQKTVAPSDPTVAPSAMQKVGFPLPPEREGEEDDVDGIAAIEKAKQNFILGKNVRAESSSTTTTGAEVEEELDFDRTLQMFMLDPRRAHATERLLTKDEEEKKIAENERLERDRAMVPGVGAKEAEEQIQLTRREWLERGGDNAFHMMEKDSAAVGQEDDDNDDGISLSSIEDSDGEDAPEGLRRKMEESEKARSVDDTVGKDGASGVALSGSSVLDQLLSALEHLVTTATLLSRRTADVNAEEEPEKRPAVVSSSSFHAQYHALITKLYTFGQKNPILLSNTFRLVIMEAERVSLRGRLPRPSLVALLMACTQLFPITDYRHPVILPLLLYLGSAVFQLRLHSRQHVKGLVLFAALLTRCVTLSEGKKFIPEAIIAVFNVLALQLPLFHLVRDGSRFQGLKVPFPLVERPRSPLSAWTNTKHLHMIEDAGAVGNRKTAENLSLHLPVLLSCGVKGMCSGSGWHSQKNGTCAPPTTDEERDPEALLHEARAKSEVHLLSLVEDEKTVREEQAKKSAGSPPSDSGTSSSGALLRSVVYLPEADLLSHENWEERVAEDEHLLCVGYSLLLQLADAYHDIAAFQTILWEPMEKLHQILEETVSLTGEDDASQERKSPKENAFNSSPNHRTGSASAGFFQYRPSPVLRSLHQRVRTRLAELSEEQQKKRTPLAMRTFRPRPLRQFDPLLEEREEIAVKSEIRELKKTVREDRKRVLRHVQAEATVTKRKREAVQAVHEQEKQKAYNRVLGQLQAQQHVMNTVDAAMERGRKKVKKGISGATKSAGDGVPEY